LVNERGVQNADGNNYVIREGIIIIPKHAVLHDGTVI
jgi:glucose-1-phosphate adenylyltransferase